MYKIVIDANVWIRYARAKDIAPLLNILISYNFLPVVNNYLLSEIFDALVENKWMHENDAQKIITFIRKIALADAERAVYALSPDPKDNYLFDLAVQNNCVFIITDDTKLLDVQLKAVPVYSANWFQKKFPL
jgi:putative PIN family toxin of toxin-antitoxin system